MAATSVQDQDLIVLGRRPQASQEAPQQQAGRSAAADPLQARMQQAMRARPDGSLVDIQACLVLCASVRYGHSPYREDGAREVPRSLGKGSRGA